MTSEEERIALNYAAIDLRIEEWLRDLEDMVDEYEIEEEDRAMIIYFMRLSYLRGYEDGGGSAV